MQESHFNNSMCSGAGSGQSISISISPANVSYILKTSKTLNPVFYLFVTIQQAFIPSIAHSEPNIYKKKKVSSTEWLMLWPHPVAAIDPLQHIMSSVLHNPVPVLLCSLHVFLCSWHVLLCSWQFLLCSWQFLLCSQHFFLFILTLFFNLVIWSFNIT